MHHPHWTQLTDSPNAPLVRRQRRRVVRQARRPSTNSRTDWLRAFVAGKRVLDLGCVDHLGQRFEAAPLHRSLSAAARSLVGVDSAAEGVRQLSAEGFDVRLADVTAPDLVTLTGAAFDVVVAGELVEHLLDLSNFFANARRVLAVNGRLVISTPNPHSLVLALGNAFGKSIDNADHVVYHWPTGMVEIATRTGFVVEQVLGERRLGPRRQAPLFAAAWLVAKVLPASFADCKSLIYVLRPADDSHSDCG